MLKGKPKLSGGKSFELIPEGLYTVQVLDVDEATWEIKGQTVEGYNFKFGILDEEDLPESGETTRGRYLWSRVSNAITKKAYLHKLAVAALGRPLTEEEQDPSDDNDDKLNPNDLVGSQLIISVIHTEKEGIKYANIESGNFTKARHKLEPMEYSPEETETKRTVTKPVKKVVEEDDEEESDVQKGLPNLNPELDKYMGKNKKAVDEDEEEGDLDGPVKAKKSKLVVVEETEEDEEEDEELAELEAAAKRAKAKLEAKKAEKKK